MGGILEGTIGLVLGVANKRSVAWASAKALHREGQKVVLTYASERMEAGVRKLAAEVDCELILPCDVTKPEEMDALAATIKEKYGRLDTLLHGIAYAKRDELKGSYMETSREGYQLAHEVSSYSLPALARRLVPLMKEHNGSIITLTYLGSERVIPNYNIMGVAKAALEASVRYLAHDLGPLGIRVNAISAGPIRTLSASGIEGFSDILDKIASTAPLRRNINSDEVADTCAFLASQMSRGITGSTLYVDAGYHIMGL